MGNNVYVHLNYNWEYNFLSLINFKKYKNVTIKLDDGGMKVEELFTK